MRARLPTSWIGCAVLFGLALAGCGAASDDSPADANVDDGEAALSPLSVAVLGSAAKVRPDEAAEGAASAVLVAARNEFESFQVAVSAPGEGLRNLGVALAGPLSGPAGAVIPASNVTVYRVGYYPVATPSDLEGAPGRWPDPLIPAQDRLFGEARNAFPVDVPAGENRVAWIDVQVPVDAPAGTYAGELQVTAEGFASSVPIQLTVLALTLPSTTTLKSSFGLSRETCRGFGVEDCSPETAMGLRQLLLRVALDNRVTLGHPHLTPIVEEGDAGTEEFRTYLLPFLNGTAQTLLPGAQLTTFQVNRHMERDIAGWRSELARHGVEDRAFVWSCDEPHYFPVYGDPAGNWPLCIERLEADHASWPEVPKLVTAHIQTAEEHGATSLIDIMVVNVAFLHGPPDTELYPGNQRPLYDEFLANATRPKQLWMYSACGSHGCTFNDREYTSGWAGGYQIDAPASQTRAMPWLAFSYDLSGIFYYDTVLQLATAWDDQYRFTGNGEGTFFYPGTPDRIGGTQTIPIESIRLKLVRDGYEDYELLHYLRENGRAEDAYRIARSLFPAPYDTSRSDAQVQAARVEVARIAAELSGAPLTSGSPSTDANTGRRSR